MSSFWSWWVIIITVGNIVACYWLIKWASKPKAGEAATGDVTGHKWDENLEEFNNPLPRWWLWLFYITIVFGLAYIVLYPGAGNFAGTLGWTSKGQYNTEIERADARYNPIFANYAKQSVEDLAMNAEAVKVGQRLYLNYCAVCHASTATGGVGFPNLTDGEWLYGGSADAIKTSILDGRMGVMPPWEAALGDQGLDEMTQYVLSLSGRQHDAQQAAAGKAKYDTMCVACHGMDGTGNQALGAPNLTDNNWLYGGSPGVIRQTLAKGRNGVMPAHRDFLGEDKVHVLAAYIYSLSAK
jgi:cytochrome c oxidase cbb3-type subunit 3